MPLPWPAALFPRGALLGLATALAGALIGGWIGARLNADAWPERPRLRGVAVAGAAPIFALVGYGLYSTWSRRRVGDRDAGQARRDGGRDDRACTATSRTTSGSPSPRGRAAGLVVDRLRETAPGVYRTTKPLPIGGDWKTMIRLHKGYALTALPIYLPADPAIPVGGVPARSDSSARSATSASCSSASARPPRAGCGAPPTSSCWLPRSASSCCSPGACTASPRPSRRARAPLAARARRRSRWPHDPARASSADPGIPFAGPAVMIFGVLAYLKLRDRWRSRSS